MVADTAARPKTRAQEMIARYPCWATPIVFRRCGMPAVVNRALIELVKSAATYRPTDALSQVGGWRTEADLLRGEHPCMATLLGHVYEACRDMHAAVFLGLPERPLPAVRAEAWGNIYASDDFQIPHIHHDSVFSAVYYAAVPRGGGAGEIEFFDPRPGVPKSSGNGGGTLRVVPTVGLLLMFPSWLRHSVRPHGSRGRRISIAFNIGLDRE